MRIHLSALGCRLNEAELEQWATAFKGAGDQITTTPDDADVMVMNTCAVTREAVRKLRQKLQRLQRDNPAAKLVVSGCYSELAPASDMAELGVDLVVPNTKKDNLVALTREAFVQPDMPQAATIPATTALFNRNRHRAFIKIQDGCRCCERFPAGPVQPFQPAPHGSYGRRTSPPRTMPQTGASAARQR